MDADKRIILEQIGLSSKALNLLQPFAESIDLEFSTGITCTSKVDPHDLLALALETLNVLHDNDERHSCSPSLGSRKNKICWPSLSIPILNDRTSLRVANDIGHSVHRQSLHSCSRVPCGSRFSIMSPESQEGQR